MEHAEHRVRAEQTLAEKIHIDHKVHDYASVEDSKHAKRDTPRVIVGVRTDEFSSVEYALGYVIDKGKQYLQNAINFGTFISERVNRSMGLIDED